MRRLWHAGSERQDVGELGHAGAEREVRVWLDGRRVPGGVGGVGVEARAGVAKVDGVGGSYDGVAQGRWGRWGHGVDIGEEDEEHGREGEEHGVGHRGVEK